MIIVLLLFFVVESGPGEVAPDRVYDEKQKRQNQYSQHHVYRYLTTFITHSLPYAIFTI